MSDSVALAPDAAVLGSRVRGSPLVLLLDVDGTIAPTVPHPDDATVPEATRRALRALVAADRVHVGLVSGRAARDARDRVGVSGVWAVGNHGLETIDPNGVLSIDQRGAKYAEAIAHAAGALTPELQRWPGAYVEDKGLTLSVHYRLASAASVDDIQGAVMTAAADAGLRVTRGSMVFEVRPPVAVDKGTAVLALAEQLGAGIPGASIVFAGDDTTDEDAMLALRGWRREAVTIHVRGIVGWSSAAELEVESPAALAVWLDSLARLRGAPARAGGTA